MNIRSASVSDASVMCEIYNYAVLSRSSTCDLEPLSLAAMEALFDGRDLSKRPIYSLDLDERMVGYLSVSNFWNDRPGYQVTADCGVYLHPDFQSRGFGRHLVQKLLDESKNLGLYSIVTSMFSDNKASVALFRSMGFVEIGSCKKVALLDGEWKDLTIVQRSIN